jgi:hypothetical protein
MDIFHHFGKFNENLLTFRRKTHLLVVCSMPVSCSPNSSILTNEKTCSSETSPDLQRTGRRYIPEYKIHMYCLERKPDV